MQGKVLTSRPITEENSGFLLLETPGGVLEKHMLTIGSNFWISRTDDDKFCTGWYDIRTHTNHSCEQSSNVDIKYEACFACRTKTGFNPAFYNSGEVSEVQKEYNSKPHTTYIAYFGEKLIKAGIMSDSRGLERLYEQGALLYAIVGKYESADQARKHEAGLIAKGFKNSITKKQKEQAYEKPFNEAAHTKKLYEVLSSLGLSEMPAITCNLDHFFSGSRQQDTITPIAKLPVSGKIIGQIGRYLVINNNSRLYGFWLDKLHGYNVNIEDKIEEIEAEPLQATLF